MKTSRDLMHSVDRELRWGGALWFLWGIFSAVGDRLGIDALRIDRVGVLLWVGFGGLVVTAMVTADCARAVLAALTEKSVTPPENGDTNQTAKSVQTSSMTRIPPKWREVLSPQNQTQPEKQGRWRVLTAEESRVIHKLVAEGKMESHTDLRELLKKPDLPVTKELLSDLAETAGAQLKIEWRNKRDMYDTADAAAVVERFLRAACDLGLELANNIVDFQLDAGEMKRMAERITDRIRQEQIALRSD